MADGVAQAKAMTEQELLAFLTTCETSSSSFGQSELPKAQTEALDRFYGRDYGNEQSGRSKAKTFDVRELINWAMPALMRVFQASDDLVTIDSADNAAVPEQIAKQMADGLNHIYFNDNDGYGNTYDFLMDGLLQRVGVMQVRWRPPELQPPEMFEDVNVLKLGRLVHQGYRILSHRPCEDEGQAEDQPGDGAEPLDGAPHPDNYDPSQCFDVIAQRSLPGRIEVRTVPPEEFSWEKTARSLEDSRYHRRQERVFLADLKQSYPEKANALGQGASSSSIEASGGTQAQWLSRHQGANASVHDDDLKYANREWLVHEFVRVDYDGDGIIELREILRVGTIILHNEVVEASEYHVWSPVRVPHTVAGLSLADDAIEIQGIRTALTRRGLDSLAMALNPKVGYDKSKVDEATLDALLDNKFGGLVPVDGTPADGLYPMTVPDVSDKAMSWNQYFKGSVEQQTGIGPGSNGIDPTALSANQSGVATNLMQMASSGRLEMIARAAADGLQCVFKSMLRLVVQHQDEVRTIQRVGKAPLVLDPSQWSPDAAISLHVAIATASRNSQLAHLNVIAGKQEQILLQLGPENPLVGLDQYANTLSMMTEAMGFRSSERFFKQIPAGQPVQMPPKEDPKIVQAKLDFQLAHDKMTAEQTRLDEQQAQNQAREERKTAAELDMKRRQIADELTLKRATAEEEINLQRELAGLKKRAGLNGGSNGSMPEINVGGKPG